MNAIIKYIFKFLKSVYPTIWLFKYKKAYYEKHVLKDTWKIHLLDGEVEPPIFSTNRKFAKYAKRYYKYFGVIKQSKFERLTPDENHRMYYRRKWKYRSAKTLSYRIFLGEKRRHIIRLKRKTTDFMKIPKYFGIFIKICSLLLIISSGFLMIFLFRVNLPWLVKPILVLIIGIILWIFGWYYGNAQLRLKILSF